MITRRSLLTGTLGSILALPFATTTAAPAAPLAIATDLSALRAGSDFSWVDHINLYAVPEPEWETFTLWVDPSPILMGTGRFLHALHPETTLSPWQVFGTFVPAERAEAARNCPGRAWLLSELPIVGSDIYAAAEQYMPNLLAWRRALDTGRTA